MAVKHSQTDNELVERLKSGNHTAYMEIYHRYSKLLQQQAYNKLGNADDVQDVLQQLFTDLWEKRESLHIKGELFGYLLIATKNRILNHIYRKRRESDYLNSLQDFLNHECNHTDNVVMEKELSEIIRDEINGLPERTKQAFVLSREKGLSHKEIAERMGISQNTVSKQISNAIKILRKKITVRILMLFIN